jgi:hypothetical protein
MNHAGRGSPLSRYLNVTVSPRANTGTKRCTGSGLETTARIENRRSFWVKSAPSTGKKDVSTKLLSSWVISSGAMVLYLPLPNLMHLRSGQRGEGLYDPPAPEIEKIKSLADLTASGQVEDVHCFVV